MEIKTECQGKVKGKVTISVEKILVDISGDLEQTQVANQVL